jgi:hypothetical protein
MGQYSHAMAVAESCNTLKFFIKQQKEVSTLFVLWNYADESDLSFKDFCINLTQEKYEELKNLMPLYTMDAEIDMESDERIEF